ncbi:MAG TPA: thioredoxin family protein [Pseudomonadales bacterium]|nr:thioredoxin family protein [Pseudomonadales bacterium]
MKKIIMAALACCAFVSVHAADLTWLTDVPQAEAQAKSQNKLVLMDFTGSDWCSWCMKLDKDTFSQPEFADYAKKNLVLVQLDYPQHKEQSDDLKAANAALVKKYNIEGYPTLIALKPDGTVVWTQVGYLEGGPKALIDELDKAKQK